MHPANLLAANGRSLALEAGPLRFGMTPRRRILNAAPRCHAKSKRSGFQRQAPAVRGKKVCRMHGARAGAPKGERHGNYRHGLYSNEMRELAYNIALNVRFR